MTKTNDTCKKVSSLLSLYLDNRLSDEAKKYVSNHLMICQECNKKFQDLKNLVKNIRISYAKFKKDLSIDHTQFFSIRDYENFYSNISAYMDNELTEDDKVKFEDYLKKSKAAASDLESFFSIQKLLKQAFLEKQRMSNNKEYKNIIKLLNFKEEYKRTNNFKNIAAVFLILIIGISIFISFNFVDLSEKFNNLQKDVYVYFNSESPY